MQYCPCLFSLCCLPQVGHATICSLAPRRSLRMNFGIILFHPCASRYPPAIFPSLSHRNKSCGISCSRSSVRKICRREISFLILILPPAHVFLNMSSKYDYACHSNTSIIKDGSFIDPVPCGWDSTSHDSKYSFENIFPSISICGTG